MRFANFLKRRLILIYSIVSECLQTNFSYISRAHILESKRCFNVKSSTYYFHMMTKISADFQICIGAPLSVIGLFLLPYENDLLHLFRLFLNY